MPLKVAEQVTKEARRSRWGQLSGDGLRLGVRPSMSSRGTSCA